MEQENTLPSFKNIKETLSFLPDLDSKYQFIIDLGKSVPAIKEKEKIDEYRIWGCQSSVWIVPIVDDKNKGLISFRAKSDSILVNGIVVIVLSLVNNTDVKSILDKNLLDELKSLDLDSHLSSGRKNGLESMVKKIKEYAVSYS